jgi:hypothetical protein
VKELINQLGLKLEGRHWHALIPATKTLVMKLEKGYWHLKM